MDHLLSIKAFVTVANFQSFTRAAHHLGMSPAALSRAIANLETHTCTRLINRSTRHVSLAEDAREYFISCTEILEQLDREESRLSQQRNSQTGALRLAAHPFAVELGLSQLVADYLSQTPEVNVVVSTTSDPLRLEHGSYDVALYPRFLIQDSAAICRPLIRSTSILVATRAYLQANHGEPSSLDFCGHTFINTRTGSCEAEAGGDRISAGAVPRNARLHVVVNESMAVQLALNSFGIALLPYPIARRYLASGRLVRVLPEYEVSEPRAELDVAFIHRRTLPRRVRDFVDRCMVYFDGVDDSVAERPVAIAD
jgi:DNA-binding transcriptional LysR family regulator